MTKVRIQISHPSVYITIQKIERLTRARLIYDHDLLSNCLPFFCVSFLYCKIYWPAHFSWFSFHGSTFPSLCVSYLRWWQKVCQSVDTSTVFTSMEMFPEVAFIISHQMLFTHHTGWYTSKSCPIQPAQQVFSWSWLHMCKLHWALLPTRRFFEHIGLSFCKWYYKEIAIMHPFTRGPDTCHVHPNVGIWMSFFYALFSVLMQLCSYQTLVQPSAGKPHGSFIQRCESCYKTNVFVAGQCKFSSHFFQVGGVLCFGTASLLISAHSQRLWSLHVDLAKFATASRADRWCKAVLLRGTFSSSMS